VIKHTALKDRTINYDKNMGQCGNYNDLQVTR